MTSVRSITTVVVIGLTWLAPPGIEAQSSDLFSPVERPAALQELSAPASHDASVVRRRLVTIDLERLQRAHAAASVHTRLRVHAKIVSPRRGKSDVVPATDEILTLNLFEDAVLTGIVERTAPTFSGGYSISGRLVDDPLGTLTLVVNGETVAGSVRTLGGTYQIRSVAGGLYAISEVEDQPLNCVVVEP